MWTSGSRIYWTDRNLDKIQRSYLDGSNIEDIVTGLDLPGEIVVDINNEKIYWSDFGTDKIQRANLDGSSVEDLVTSGLGIPHGIAIDFNNNKLYWVDAEEDKLERSDLDGSNRETLISSGLYHPVAIVVDPVNNKICWTDNDYDEQPGGYPCIRRADLDGSNVEDIVTSGLDSPEGIGIDASGGKLYWVDFGTDKIQRSNLDGSDVEDLVTTGLHTPHGLAVDTMHNKIYWVDHGNDTMKCCNLDGSEVTTLLSSPTLDYPDGISLLLATGVTSGEMTLITTGSVMVSGNVNLVMMNTETPEIEILEYGQIVPDFIYSPDAPAAVVGCLVTGQNVSIELWDMDGQSVSIISASCSEIGNTGQYSWSTHNIGSILSGMKQYHWRMSDINGNIDQGNFVLHVYENLDSGMPSLMDKSTYIVQN